MTHEAWRPIVGFEDRYEVSDRGRVRSLPSRTWPTVRLLSLATAKRGGYQVAVLRMGGQQFNRKVHHLVLEAFVGPRPDGQLCRHRDGNPLNNHVSNLAWGTGSDNNRDAVTHGTHASARKTHCLNGHPLRGDNLYVTPSTGARQCRACQREAKARYRNRRHDHAV